MLRTTDGRRLPRGPLFLSAARPALTLVLVLLLAACASEEPTAYGPTVAGPTKTSKPKTSAPGAVPSSEDPELAPVRVSGAALCDLFTTAEMTELLGLEVDKVVVSRQGAYSVCTWKTTRP